MSTSIAFNRDLEAHLEKVRQRLEREDLSALELRQRHEQKYREIADGSLSETQLKIAQAEADLIVGMARESSAPAPTPQEVLQDFRDRGLHLEAENLEHSISISGVRDALTAAQKDVRDAEAALLAANGTEEPWRLSNRRTDIERKQAIASKAETALMEAESAPTPHAIREDKRKALVSEAESLRRSSDSIQDSGGLDSQRKEQLAAQSQAKYDEARGLDQQNRGVAPLGAA